jgi:NAD(P)-dependent dehydrogenase (short-subunit alcohol dehydrogenase family)
MAAPLAPLDLFRLDGSLAVVTGASGGLGARFARVLHGAGAQVVVAARRVERLERLAAELPGAIAVAADVADDGDRTALVETAARAAAERGLSFDVLVNNAGIGEIGPAEDEPLETFEHVVDVNLTALFRLSQLAGRHFLDAGHGSIVNIASMLGLVASAPIKQASYVASKGGVVSLTRELGCQWAARGVRVNALAPGWFRSEMTAESMFDDERSMAFVTRNCPARRAGEEHELDGALLFLASNASTYVTGQTLTVDGGWTAR